MQLLATCKSRVKNTKRIINVGLSAVNVTHLKSTIPFIPLGMRHHMMGVDGLPFFDAFTATQWPTDASRIITVLSVFVHIFKCSIYHTIYIWNVQVQTDNTHLVNACCRTLSVPSYLAPLTERARAPVKVNIPPHSSFRRQRISCMRALRAFLRAHGRMYVVACVCVSACLEVVRANRGLFPTTTTTTTTSSITHQSSLPAPHCLHA